MHLPPTITWETPRMQLHKRPEGSSISPITAHVYAHYNNVTSLTTQLKKDHYEPPKLPQNHTCS